MNATIFTAGYTGAKLAHIESAAAHLDLTIIDTRINPVSRNPTWAKANLQTALGNRYLHVWEFGNRLYKRGGIAIVNMEAGVRQVAPFLKTGKSIVLLCACGQHQHCHRRVVADALAAATGCAIIHWNTDDLRNIGDAPSKAAAAHVPLQMSMFDA